MSIQNATRTFGGFRVEQTRKADIDLRAAGAVFGMATSRGVRGKDLLRARLAETEAASRRLSQLDEAERRAADFVLVT